MVRFGPIIIVVALALAPARASAQLVVRDDSAGWGWLALTPTHRAVVQLVYGSPQTGDQGRLDLRVLDRLRALGIRRLWDFSEFEPTESQILAECTAVEYTPPGAEEDVYALHAEVSFWDHNRLSATEIYESITVQQIASTDLATDTFVDACVGPLAGVLTRLGFDQG